MRSSQTPVSARTGCVTSCRRAHWPGRRSSWNSPTSTGSRLPRLRQEEAGAPDGVLGTSAQEVANAADGRGFTGFHAERVSEGERRMLDKLADVLAPPA